MASLDVECPVQSVREIEIPIKNPSGERVEFEVRAANLLARDITPKHATNGRIHFRGLAPGQHNSKETWQRYRAVGDTVFDLTGPGIEPKTSSTDSDILDHNDSRPVINKDYNTKNYYLLYQEG